MKLLTFDDFQVINESNDDFDGFFKEIDQKIHSLYKSGKIIISDEYSKDRVSSLLYHNKLRSLFDKKAFNIFQLKPFFRKENGYYGCFMVSYIKKEFFVKTVILYELSTSKYGKFYFSINLPNEVNDYTFSVYKSHFFDRYYDRVFNNNEKSIPTVKHREESIRDFMKNLVIQMFEEPIGSTRTKSGGIITKFKKGAGLGIQKENFLIFNTFISTEMINSVENSDIDKFSEFSKQYIEEFKPRDKKR